MTLNFLRPSIWCWIDVLSVQIYKYFVIVCYGNQNKEISLSWGCHILFDEQKRIDSFQKYKSVKNVYLNIFFNLIQKFGQHFTSRLRK